MGLWAGIMVIMMRMGLSAGKRPKGLMCYFVRLWIYKFSNMVVFWTKMSFFISDEWFLPPLCHLDVLMSWCPPFQRVIPLNGFGKLQMAGNSPQKTSSAFSLILMPFLLETLIPSFFFRNEIGKLRIAADSRQRTSDEQKMQYASQLARTNKHQVIFVMQIQIQIKYKYGFKYVQRCILQAVPGPTKITWISLFQISNVFLPFLQIVCCPPQGLSSQWSGYSPKQTMSKRTSTTKPKYNVIPSQNQFWIKIFRNIRNLHQNINID